MYAYAVPDICSVEGCITGDLVYKCKPWNVNHGWGERVKQILSS